MQCRLAQGVDAKLLISAPRMAKCGRYRESVSEYAQGPDNKMPRCRGQRDSLRTGWTKGGGSQPVCCTNNVQENQFQVL